MQTQTVQNDIGFCYGDHQGLLRFQKGVHRINCVDCLDRTNVVQRWLAENVVKDVLVKIGCLLPEDNVPDRLRAALKVMWHENGNAISRQYTGTDALKGDVTKTGKREMTGFLRDGVNSLERRYFMAQFRDSILQCTIDVLTMGYSDEAGFNFKSHLIDIAKKRLEQSDEFWSAWIVDHLESHVDLNSQASKAGSRLLPMSWNLSREKDTANAIHVFIVCSNHFYLIYVHPEKLKVVKMFKVAIKDLELVAFGIVKSSECDTCCLQIMHPMQTVESGVSVSNQITLKPVDLDEDSLFNGSTKASNVANTSSLESNKSDTTTSNQLPLAPMNASEEYLRSRAIVDKIVEDFAKARSRLSLSIKVKSGELQVSSAEQIESILALTSETAFRKLSGPVTDKLRGLLTVRPQNGNLPLGKTKSSDNLESRDPNIDKSSSSFKSPQFLDRFKNKDLWPRFAKGSSNTKVNELGAEITVQSRSQRSSLSSSEKDLSRNCSTDYLDIVIKNQNGGSTDHLGGTSSHNSSTNISTLKINPEELPNATLQAVEAPEFLSPEHDPITLVKRLQSQECRTGVLFL